jgi:uroporphyrinogen decarboxylase
VNGKQRILTALDVQQPDRVPVWIHAINEAAIANIGRLITAGVPEVKAVNRMSQAEMLKLLDTLFVLHEELEIDGFTAQGMGQLMNVTHLDDTRFRDAWGATWARSPHGMAYLVEPAFSSPDDIHEYRCPPAERSEALLVQLANDRFKGEKAVFFLMRGVFVRSWRLRGMQNLLMDFHQRPDFVHQLAEMVTAYRLELCELVVDAGADVLIVEDDIASTQNTLVSPKHFQEFIAPYNQQVIDCAKARDMKVIRHSDGNLWPILDLLLAKGYDGLNPLDPNAGMDLKKVKDYCGDRICLLGNIDCGDLLTNGSEEQVEAAVIQAINDAAPGGGYILCSSNSIHPGVKPENFLAMIRAAKAHGEYAVIESEG